MSAPQPTMEDFMKLLDLQPQQRSKLSQFLHNLEHAEVKLPNGNTKSVSHLAEEAKENVRENIKAVKDTAKDVKDTAKETSKGMWNLFKRETKNAVEDGKDVVQDAKKEAKNLQHEGKEMAQDAVETVQRVAKKDGKTLMKDGKEMVENQKEGAVDMAQDAKKMVKNVSKDARAVVGDVKHAVNKDCNTHPYHRQVVGDLFWNEQKDFRALFPKDFKYNKENIIDYAFNQTDPAWFDKMMNTKVFKEVFENGKDIMHLLPDLLSKSDGAFDKLDKLKVQNEISDKKDLILDNVDVIKKSAIDMATPVINYARDHPEVQLAVLPVLIKLWSNSNNEKKTDQHNMPRAKEVVSYSMAEEFMHNNRIDSDCSDAEYSEGNLTDNSDCEQNDDIYSDEE